MDQHEKDTTALHADGEEPIPGTPTTALSEFVCPGCDRPLNIALRSTMCFAEAQVYCPACERDYRQKRGKWAE